LIHAGWLAEHINEIDQTDATSHELNQCNRPTMDGAGDGSSSHSHPQEQPVAAAAGGGDGDGGDDTSISIGSGIGSIGSGDGSGTTSPSAMTYSQHRQQHASIVNACIQDLSSRGVVATESTGVSHSAAGVGSGGGSSSSFAGRQLSPTPLDASAAAAPPPASSLHHGRGYPTVGSAASSTNDGAHPRPQQPAQQMHSLGAMSHRGEHGDDSKAKEDRVAALREEQERRMRVKRISKEGAATATATGAASSTAAASALTDTGSDAAAHTSATDTTNAPALDSSSPAGIASPSNAPSPSAAAPTSAAASAPAPSSTTTTAAAMPSAPATAATPAVGPPGWFVCSVCKARAFASEADLAAHQPSCAAEAEEAERRKRYAKEQAALMEKLNSARAEVAALESAAARQQQSMQQSMRQQLHPPSAAGAAAVTYRPQQQQQQQQTQHPVVGMSQQQISPFYGTGMSSTSAATTAAANTGRSAIDSLQFGDVNRLAMQEMARRAVAAAQGPPPPPPPAALQHGQHDQLQYQQQMQFQQLQMQHVQMQMQMQQQERHQQQQQHQQQQHQHQQRKQQQRQRKQQQKHLAFSESETSAVAAASPRGASPMPAQVAGGGVENVAHLEVPVPLGIPLDKDMLTPLHCFVREHCVQIFTATDEDVNAPSKGKRRPILVGQVGIRCPHCKGRPNADANKSASAQSHGNSSGAERGSVYYPFTIASIYNATMNLLQRHLPYCTCIPAWTLDRYRDLKTDDARSGTSKQYWIDAAKRLGLIDTPAGIRYDPKLVDPSLGAESQGGMMTSFPTSGGEMPPLGPPPGANRDFYSNQSNASTRTINMDTCTTVGGAALLAPHQQAAAAMRAAAVQLGMQADKESPHQPNNMLTTTGPADDAVRLVDPADRPLATSFSYYIMSQMQKCHFAEADRLGKRKALPLGFAGLACRHCYGGYGSGRFFPSTIKTLSDTSKTLNVLHNHMMRCRKCPIEVRDSLEKLKSRHDVERARMKFGSQKAFFERIWARLHDNRLAGAPPGGSTTSQQNQHQHSSLAKPASMARPANVAKAPPPADNPLAALALLAGMKRKDRGDAEERGSPEKRKKR